MFLGLTPKEIKGLKNLGVEEVKVVKHSEGLSYQEVSADFIPVENLRLVRSPSTSVEVSQTSYAGILLVIVVIIVLIALIFGAWYYYKKGGRFGVLSY